MTVIEPGGAPQQAQGMVARAMALITRPAEAWKAIEPEPGTAQSLFMGWLVPLALIAAAAQVIGQTVFGTSALFVTYKPSLVSALIGGAASFLLLCGMTWVMALVINGLAPNFGGTQNETQALKTAVYSGTAAFVASFAQIFPPLAILGLIGVVVSVFTLHAGLPVMMKSPHERTFGYTLSVCGVMLVLWLIAGFAYGSVMGPILGAGAFSSITRGGDREHGSVEINGQKIDVDALEKAAKDFEASVKTGDGSVSINLGAASGPPVDLEKIKALLPERIAGLARTEISTGSGGAAGFGASAVTGRYGEGDKSIEINIVDMGAMGAIAGMAGAFGVQGTTENNDGFEKVHTVNGRMVMEKLSRSAKTASYGVMVGGRFMLQAEGQNVTFEEVKAAVDAVGEARVAALVPPAQ